jgi:RNA polymerase sigma-70 factor (ECF subfamily)
MPHAPPPEADHDRRERFERTALVHLDSLYGLARKLTRDPVEAEDLTQETFLRAYRFFDRFEPGTNCRAWLFRILRNCFCNRVRRGAVRPGQVNFSAIEEKLERLVLREEVPAPPDPGQALDAARLRREIEEAMEELPPDYRSALILAVAEGFSYREVAEILGCPMGTVMSRVHRARKHLQARLARTAGRIPEAGRAPGAREPRRTVSFEKYRKPCRGAEPRRGRQ